MDEQSRKQIERTLADSDRPIDPSTEEPATPEVPSDRKRNFRSPNFSRMRTTWRGEDKIVIEEIKVQARKVTEALFPEAHGIMDRLYLAVREPLIGPDNQVRTGPDGRPVWRCHDNGSPVENWTLLSDHDRRNALFEITTHLFEWEQRAAELWGEAMFAKVSWEERFADGFMEPQGRQTVDDRVQAGTKSSIEERYFAVFKALLSRKADALVRTMGRLEQRLKDTSQL